MLHDTSRDCAADDLYPDRLTDAEARRIRGERVRHAMFDFYRSWNARYSGAMANSPIHAPRAASR